MKQLKNDVNFIRQFFFSFLNSMDVFWFWTIFGDISDEKQDILSLMILE